jgi:ubiquinone/menaquinone biosynthesis C-methylase UbiE
MIWDKNIEVEPYQALAPIYDELMSHVEYTEWAEFILNILRRHLKWPPMVMEIACGTGIIAGRLAEKGVKVVGYDRSPAMIAQAERRHSHPNATFSVASFANFPVRENFPAIICLYDSINYIMSYSDLVKFFARVQNTLQPEGIFIFDICTRYNSYRNFRKYYDRGQIGQYHYSRYSDYNPITHLHINDFTVIRLDHPEEKYREYHEQFIYSRSQIKNALRQAGLKLLTSFDDISQFAPRLSSLRIHYLTQKL